MIKPEDTYRKSTLNSGSDITCRTDLIVLVIYLTGCETDGAGCYHLDTVADPDFCGRGCKLRA